MSYAKLLWQIATEGISNPLKINKFQFTLPGRNPCRRHLGGKNELK
jgi:hypothetical protein